jgi:hypothetical protein
MSDFGRKDFSTQMKEGMQPDSTKSTADKMKESVTDAGDKVSRNVVPDTHKSDSQGVADNLTQSKDNTVHGGTSESILDKTKNALGMGDKH